MKAAIVSKKLRRKHNCKTAAELDISDSDNPTYKYEKALPGKRERSKGRPRRRRPPRRRAGRRLTCELNNCRTGIGPLH